MKRYHYDKHTQLEAFIAAYNYARCLKTPQSLTPFEYIYKIWTTEPVGFKMD